jgi:hypothetical protein
VQTAFPFVVFGAVAFSVVMSLAFLLTRESAHDQIGAGGLSRDGEIGEPAMAAAPDSAAGRAERELEIRQMLGARSARLARLLEPSPADKSEPGLSEEVRQLVVARNERRVRQGLEPLEVDAEVARTLAEFDR